MCELKLELTTMSNNDLSCLWELLIVVGISILRFHFFSYIFSLSFIGYTYKWFFVDLSLCHTFLWAIVRMCRMFWEYFWILFFQFFFLCLCCGHWQCFLQQKPKFSCFALKTDCSIATQQQGKIKMIHLYTITLKSTMQ